MFAKPTLMSLARRAPGPNAPSPGSAHRPWDRGERWGADHWAPHSNSARREVRGWPLGRIEKTSLISLISEERRTRPRIERKIGSPGVRPKRARSWRCVPCCERLENAYRPPRAIGSRHAVEFGVEIGEYRGVVRVPRRVFQRLLPERPTPERCVEALYLQRTRFESIAEGKLRRRQLTEDGNVEISGQDLR